MLKLRPVSVFGKTKAYLVAEQAKIDGQPDYESMVIAAQKAWGQKNRAVFTEIRATLELICGGARRCLYCEDSAADEVEHVWPKKFYPQKTFTWQNYLFSCGPCNGSHKSDQFAVFDINGNAIDIVRKIGDPVVTPPSGEPLFIDPTNDDPTEYMSLDLGTGLFVPKHPKGSRKFKRAEYTIKVLGLNSRDYLSRARRNAYAAYKDALDSYSALKSLDRPQKELLANRLEISEKHHPSVWHEIKASAQQGIAHKKVFDQSPELYGI